MTLEASPADTLAARTITTLREFFTIQDHRPSEEHWTALEDIANTLEDMADQACKPKVFLSAVDPGVGKTQTVTHFARALTQDARYLDVGMIVCVGRIAEATSLARNLGLPQDRFAVLTNDPEANALGSQTPHEAQVLITTQQRIELSCDGRTFAEVEAFHYGRTQGHRRSRLVRVWDEAWLPGRALTLDKDDIWSLVKPLRPLSAPLADSLGDLGSTLHRIGDGESVDVPDFEARYGVSKAAILATVLGSGDKVRDDRHLAALALNALSGKSARARVDGTSGTVILTYRDTLPADLLPMIVLDASARVRQTYSDIEEHRGTIVRLHTAEKDYSPLTVHTWQTSGSKSGFERQGDRLVAGIVEAIMTKPDEEWLCVVHKPDRKVGGVEAAIRRALPIGVQAKVKTITWGFHMETNAYADVPNVILAGTLFMRHSQYTALTHLSRDQDVAGGLVSAEAVKQTIRGENANVVLQALCRGRVRKSDGARCHPMSAYIIATAHSGIPDDITTIFPGCTVKDWHGRRRELTGKRAAALRFIEAALQKAPWVSYRDVARGLDTEYRNFCKLVLKHPAWIATIADSPFEEARTDDPKRTKGVRLKRHDDLQMTA